MITFAFDAFSDRSRPDGSRVLTFEVGVLTPEQLGEIAKIHNNVGVIGITLQEDFSDKEKEVLNKAIELSNEEVNFTGVIKDIEIH